MNVRFALILSALLAVVVASVTSVAGVSYIASEQITVAATAIGFTTSKITPNGGPGQAQAVTAICRLETAEIRYTNDGTTTPTSSVGTLLEIGDVLTVQGHDVLVNFKAIRTGGSSGQLDCTYSSP